MQSIIITCTIKALEDFHIGTGIGNIGLYDDGQFKDSDGFPTLNSSTLKGLLRDSCAALDRAKQKLNIEVDRECFRKLFENFDNLSSLDIKISPKENQTLSDNTLIHYFTAIEHARRKAKRGTLHSLEFGASGLEFELEIRYLNRSIDSEELAKYIIDGLKNIKSIGGHRRRGFGAIAMNNIEYKVDEITAEKGQVSRGSQLDIIFELYEDTILSSKAQSGNLLSTNDYIPGTTILGMFRSIMLARGLANTYLDDDRLKASFFYPMPKAMNNSFDIEVSPVFLSFRKKKVYLTPSSFAPENVLKDLPGWAVKTSSDPHFATILSHNTLFSDAEHSDPGKGLYEGYIYREKNDPEWTKSSYYKVDKLYHQRNKIDPNKQSTDKAGVFIEEKVKQGTRFLGSLFFESEEGCSAFVQDFQPWLKGSTPLHTGRGGKAVRIKQYQLQANPSGSSHAINEDGTFTLSLLSDTILYNKNLRPCKAISADVLSAILGEPFNGSCFQLLGYVSRAGIISSFSGTSGLRRFRDIAIRKGSCFRYKYTGTDVAALQDRLNELSAKGIGIRKNEGFGAISINHPLHDLKPRESDTSQAPKLCPSLLPENEKILLSQKASSYEQAKQISKELSKYKKEKWKSMLVNVLVHLESGVEINKLTQTLSSKMDPNTNGHWDANDSRSKIAIKLIEYINKSTPNETLAIAIKMMLEGQGEKND